MANEPANPFIRKFDYLHHLSAEEKKVLEGLCSTYLSFAADQDIVREGDHPTTSSVLLEGIVFRYQITPDGKRQILSFHIPGDVFDAQSFLLETMDHSVGALTACKLALIPHEKLAELTETHPRLGRAFWKDTLVDAAIFREWIVNVGRRSAYQRIAHLICEMFARLQVVGLAKDNRMGWPFTQTEIGDATGLSVVHVNRTLQELRQAGLIALSNPTLAIHDWEALQEAGQFDRRYLHLSPPPANTLIRRSSPRLT
jgi:CRP-like cAMP-binding protein